MWYVRGRDAIVPIAPFSSHRGTFRKNPRWMRKKSSVTQFSLKKMSSLRNIRRKSPPRFANISHVSHDPAQRVTFAEPSTLVATLPARVAAFDNRHSRLDLGQPSTARGLLTDGNLFRLEKREIFAARRGARRE